VTGAGASRTAHLFDPANGIEATVVVPETLDGLSNTAFLFTLKGSANTTYRTYIVAIIISPDSDEVRKEWNTSIEGPQGAGTVPKPLSIPAGELDYTIPNVPFRAQLRWNGIVVDFADFSIDIRAKTPPADGGLTQLAIATVFFWGIVFLYAGYLHLTQRKLRAKADALERAIAPSQEAPGRGNRP
jgi:hypothetical protein